MSTQNVELSRAVLVAAGLKATRARLAVLSYFRRVTEPLSAQEAAKGIPRGMADQATVYRVVQSFLEAGILREVNLRHGHADYELADRPDHHHVVCLGCGKVEEFDGCGAEALSRAVLKKLRSFRSIEEHAIELFGYCTACA